MNESHSSSYVSPSSCKSFLFHRNGTASGFIKIYELHHHWKYKTLVGAHGEMGEEGGRQAERGEETVPTGEEEKQEEEEGEKINRERDEEGEDKRREIGGFW